jgi:probable F420-dependent oxidoreductase
LSHLTELPTLGLVGVNLGPCATAHGITKLGALAEELGYDSIWVGDHVVLPSPRVEPSPLEPEHVVLDPLVTLALLAAVTKHVRLATGVLILPQRNPVVLAKQLASLDFLSQGRVIFGMGVGYLEPEMRAIGVPMQGRGARADEYLQAMRSLWEDKSPAYQGHHIQFADVDAHPRPTQNPIPVVVGGHGVKAHRRAVRYGDGWYGFSLDRRATATQIDSLRREAQVAGRDLDKFTITVTPSEPLDREVIRDYAELGVHRLVVRLSALVPGFRRSGIPLSEYESVVQANAPGRVGAALG